MWDRLGRVMIAVTLLVAGCGGEAQPPAASPPTPPAAKTPGGAVVATYAGKQLTSAEVLAEMERLPGPSRAYLAQPERKRQFVENLVLNDLLFAEAERQGYATDPEIERQVNDTRRRLAVQRLMREYQKPPEISDDEARRYYDENPTLYSTTQIAASHILVKDEAEARAIRAELERDPQRFAQLAREKSIDKASAAKGGELGRFGQGRMVPDFERVAFALAPGEISQPVKTQYGWHVILVTERQDGERKPFDQVKDQIKATLRNKALQESVQGRMEALKQQANLVIDEAVLASLAPPPGSAAGTAANPHAGAGH
jgi:peptidyl-prolyl cis-trans isomerase C